MCNSFSLNWGLISIARLALSRLRAQPGVPLSPANALLCTWAAEGAWRRCLALWLGGEGKKHERERAFQRWPFVQYTLARQSICAIYMHEELRTLTWNRSEECCLWFKISDASKCRTIKAGWKVGNSGRIDVQHLQLHVLPRFRGRIDARTVSKAKPLLFSGGPSRSSLGTSSAALAPWRLEQRHRPGGTVSGCWSGCRSEVALGHVGGGETWATSVEVLSMVLRPKTATNMYNMVLLYSLLYMQLYFN